MFAEINCKLMVRKYVYYEWERPINWVQSARYFQNYCSYGKRAFRRGWGRREGKELMHKLLIYKNYDPSLENYRQLYMFIRRRRRGWRKISKNSILN